MGYFQKWQNYFRRKINKNGSFWELKAEKYLEKQGLTSIQRNYRSVAGEIDLIMLKKPETMVFVEVRYRKHQHWSNAVESVDFHKQQRIIKTAKLYLSRKKWLNRYYIRFDILAIQGNPEQPKINWIQNAFN